jgi:hypothetical protein
LGAKETLMNCFSDNSLARLKEEADQGFTLADLRGGIIEVVLSKPDRVSADIDEEEIPIHTPADLVAVVMGFTGR